MKVTSRKLTVSLVDFKPNRKRLSPKDAQKEHFKTRFFQRVGYILSDSKYNELKAETSKNGTYLHPGTSGSVYRVAFGGMNMRVVYNPFTDILITIL
jgi:hypothetical protein